jgi:DNA-binding transcriptional ArsR family regulator
MTAGAEAIEVVLSALADPTRRLLLDALVAHGSATATMLATEVPVSRQAVVKHLPCSIRWAWSAVIGGP